MPWPVDTFHSRAPATDEAIFDFERKFGKTLPDDYVAFLKAMNGGEGSINGAWVRLWGANELQEMNEAYKVDEYAPGMLYFGTDGGGIAFAFDTRTSPWKVVALEFISDPSHDTVEAGSSFTDFIQRLQRFGTIFPEEQAPPSSIAGKPTLARFVPTECSPCSVYGVQIIDTRNPTSLMNRLSIPVSSALVKVMDNLHEQGPFVRKLARADGASLIIAAVQDFSYAEFRGSDPDSPVFATRANGVSIEAANFAPNKPDWVERVPARSWVSFATVKEAATHFLETGSRSPLVSWEIIPFSQIID